MESDAFTRLGRRELYRNPWLAVEAHEIVHPNGVPGEHVLIVTHRASAVVVEDGDALLFTRQPRFGARASVVEIVKGGCEPGESGLDCAKRELREELGLRARRWTPLGVLYEIPSIMSDPLEIFLAGEIEIAHGEPEAQECIETVRLPAREALDAAARGGIDDAVTVAALLRYRYLLENR
ncbi:MAG TPA: NUDIX hydrolase [Verrucomicrobiae bacterium]|nr:NUDIX hydrolase [Verrucomicrobiae bacterium]